MFGDRLKNYRAGRVLDVGVGAGRSSEVLMSSVKDFDDGVSHYPPDRREEIEATIANLPFEHRCVFDHAPVRDDIRDQENLDRIARHIDSVIQRYEKAPRYSKYRRLGEKIKNRMYRTGYLSAKSLVAICY